MNKENMMFGVAGLIIGLLMGILAGGKISGTSAGGPAMPPAAAGPAASPAQMSARITELEAIVAKDPKNLQAWITLGNDYFDAQNPQKAVQAYAKALELDPNNANVLTDQGVMFRALGFFDRALANFEKANSVDPKHLQSLFNQGIVYFSDLKQPAKARAIWEKLLSQNPPTELAQQTKQLLSQLPAK